MQYFLYSSSAPTQRPGYAWVFCESVPSTNNLDQRERNPDSTRKARRRQRGRQRVSARAKRSHPLSVLLSSSILPSTNTSMLLEWSLLTRHCNSLRTGVGVKYLVPPNLAQPIATHKMRKVHTQATVITAASMLWSPIRNQIAMNVWIAMVYPDMNI